MKQQILFKGIKENKMHTLQSSDLALSKGLYKLVEDVYRPAINMGEGGGVNAETFSYLQRQLSFNDEETKIALMGFDKHYQRITPLGAHCGIWFEEIGDSSQKKIDQYRVVFDTVKHPPQALNSEDKKLLSSQAKVFLSIINKHSTYYKYDVVNAFMSPLSSFEALLSLISIEILAYYDTRNNSNARSAWASKYYRITKFYQQHHQIFGASFPFIQEKILTETTDLNYTANHISDILIAENSQISSFETTYSTNPEDIWYYMNSLTFLFDKEEERLARNTLSPLDIIELIERNSFFLTHIYRNIINNLTRNAFETFVLSANPNNFHYNTLTFETFKALKEEKLYDFSVRTFPLIERTLKDILGEKMYTDSGDERLASGNEAKSFFPLLEEAGISQNIAVLVEYLFNTRISSTGNIGLNLRNDIMHGNKLVVNDTEATLLFIIWINIIQSFLHLNDGC